MKSKIFRSLRAGFSFPWGNMAAAFALCILLAAAPQVSASAAQNVDTPQNVELNGAGVDGSESGGAASAEDGGLQSVEVPQDVELNGANVDDLESGVEPLIGEYDSETGFYKYSVDEDSEIWSNALLHSGGVEVQSFWIGSDADDIVITVIGGEGVVDLEDTVVITEAGTYAVDISYSPKNGEGASWRYAVTVSHDVENSAAPDITGRLDTTADDGDMRSYTFGAIGSVQTNVVDGETASFPVKLFADDSLSCVITRDGSSYALAANGIIADDGAYDVRLTAVYADGSVETRRLSFSVYTGATNRVGIYMPPRGCVITNVTLDGESYPFTAESCRFTADGAYSVSYEGEVSRTVTLVRAATPPVLYFNGTNAAEFYEAVEITSAADCEIVIKRNGVKLGSTNLIKSSGIYVVTATDSAGNEVTYRIVVTLKQFDGLLLCAAILGALAVAGAVYLVVTKKRGIKIR